MNEVSWEDNCNNNNNNVIVWNYCSGQLWLNGGKLGGLVSKY